MPKASRYATDYVVFRTVLLWVQGLSALALLFLLVVPTAVIEHGPSLCLSRLFFGVECRGCGMTRAISCLLHGEVPRALAYNPGSLVVLPVLVIAAALIPVTLRFGSEA